MACAAVVFEVMAYGAIEVTLAMIAYLCSIEPGLAQGMIVVAIVAVFRSGSVRTGQLMALKTNTIGLGQAEFFVGDGAMLPIHSIWNFAA